MDANCFGHRTSFDCPMQLEAPPEALSRPGDTVGVRITAEDVRKASFKIGQTPLQTVQHKHSRQQRYGIRLSKKEKGEDAKSDGWLVPPHLMASMMMSVENGDVKVEKAEVKDKQKKPVKRKRSTSSSSDSSSDSESSSSSDDCCESSCSESSEMREPKKVIVVQQKQSGVIGVSWSPDGRGAWVARYSVKGVHKAKRFPLSKFKTADRTWEYAEAKALKEAIKFRQSQVKQGNPVCNGRGHRAARVSGVKGVTWNARKGHWVATICVASDRKHLGCYVPLNDSEDAVEEARLAAVAARERYEAKYFEVHLRQTARSGGA